MAICATGPPQARNPNRKNRRKMPERDWCGIFSSVSRDLVLNQITLSTKKFVDTPDDRIAGFEESGGFTGPKVDYNEHPQGDMAVAEKYMKLAGYPSGKYTGSETLQVVGDSSAPANNVAEAVNSTLQKLGFKTKLNLVEHTVMYSKYCGVVSEKIDVCPNAPSTPSSA